MQRLGYVRFGVALVAALALHALVLVLLEIGRRDTSLSSPLQITILPQQGSQQGARQSDQHFEKKVISQKAVEPSEQFTEKQTEKSEAAKPEPKEVADAAPELQLVPEQLQAAIIAKVSYPRQARRRGWQGLAELSFEVTNQAVHEIRILSSSGFSVLDQAAFTALASIRTMPLHDGPYKLPVMFQLD